MNNDFNTLMLFSWVSFDLSIITDANTSKYSINHPVFCEGMKYTRIDVENVRYCLKQETTMPKCVKIQLFKLKNI